MFKEKDLIRFYEEILVLHPDSTEAEQKMVYTSSSEVIKENKGKVYQVDTWGSRPLANQDSKGISRGLYFHMVFSAAPETIQELRRRLRINNKVVYFHHEKLPKKETPESHMEKFKSLLEKTDLKEQERQARIQKKQTSSR